jgi:hypothetical protein
VPRDSILPAGTGSTFTLNVYPEPFTPAGVKAKGLKFISAGVRRGARQNMVSGHFQI